MRRWSGRKLTSSIGGSTEISQLRSQQAPIKLRRAQLSTTQIVRSAVNSPKSRLRHSDVTRLVSVQDEGHHVGDGERAVRARHLLRSILRECTYLPDSGARTWTKQYALQRFRRYTFFVWEKREEAGYEERLLAKEKEARRWLTYLQGANEGKRKCLRRVLLMTYGRVGKRRRELLQPLMVKESLGGRNVSQAASQDIENEDEAEGDLEDDLEDGEDQRYSKKGSLAARLETFDAAATQRIAPPVTTAIRALILSQIRASPTHLTRPNPRRIDLVMPMYNAWLRPMPQVRIKNKLQQHYAELLDRVHPPLPSAEWDRLLALASGREPVQTHVARRQPANPCHEARVHGSRKTALDYVVAFGKLPNRLLPKRTPKYLPPRSMRRLYAEILGQCPRMDWDAKTQKWDITWGGKAVQAAVAGSGALE